MEFRLGINLGFAVNRFSEPEEWVRIVAEDLGLKYVQFTADLLNPSLPADHVHKEVKKIAALCARHGIQVKSTFTGAFTRVNHLAHPDADVRRIWVEWFKRFVTMSVDMGAESMGSHFGIFTARDNANATVRAERRQQNIDGWHEIAADAKAKGLRYLSWEPMSIKREQGETLDEAARLQADVNRGAPLPFFICLDVDHGDVSSPNPADTDPYSWLTRFANESPIIHLKQSSENKGGHWPFTAAHNANGKIRPKKVIDTLNAAYRSPTFDHVDLLFEMSFREREPADSTVVPVLKESVAYWRSDVPR